MLQRAGLTTRSSLGLMVCPQSMQKRVFLVLVESILGENRLQIFFCVSNEIISKSFATCFYTNVTYPHLPDHLSSDWSSPSL